MPEPLTPSDFARRLNTPFIILGVDGAHHPLEPVQVSELKQTGTILP